MGQKSDIVQGSPEKSQKAYLHYANSKLKCEWYLLIIRNRNKGDKLGRKKLKDLFIDKQIELFERDRAVIIEEDSVIIWAEYISKNNNIIFKRYGI